jgi:hypothetical protein
MIFGYSILKYSNKTKYGGMKVHDTLIFVVYWQESGENFAGKIGPSDR